MPAAKVKMTLEGLPVIDADRSIEIHIQRGDVKPTGRKNPDKCAAAQAIHREMHTEARVHLSRVYVKNGDHWLRYEMPQSLRAEIIAFDRGGKFECGQFRLRAIRESHRGPLTGGRVKTKTGTGKKRDSAVYTPNVRQKALLD